ncbi:MAG: succinate--CoA ligase subunit alpha [Chloroflexi bacterium]|nr:succinate--CoA ligase subunit alpha [Chloroflexota bacterium]MCY3936923.1 succinate--CoA ligase subunit alpha [Chloroflexota bacterium]
MSILVDADTRVLVQGITGNQGSFHTRLMLDYGANVVAGVVPGRGGQSVHDVPVFDTVEEAVDRTQPNCGIIFVPAFAAPDAILEQAAGGVPLIVCITEGIPVIDMIPVYHRVRAAKSRLIGPNCPGVISPAHKVKVGILPGQIHLPGPVGVVSRSGTLTYEVVQSLSALRLGQSTCVGIGGDPIIGTSFIEVVDMFERDPSTEAIVVIGEIGGTDEEQCAEFIADNVSKPVFAFIAGRTAPPEKRMGHAGAIVSGGSGTAVEKIKAFESAGVRVATIPDEIAAAARSALS